MGLVEFGGTWWSSLGWSGVRVGVDGIGCGGVV